MSLLQFYYYYTVIVGERIIKRELYGYYCIIMISRIIIIYYIIVYVLADSPTSAVWSIIAGHMTYTIIYVIIRFFFSDRRKNCCNKKRISQSHDIGVYRSGVEPEFWLGELSPPPVSTPLVYRVYTQPPFDGLKRNVCPD